MDWIELRVTTTHEASDAVSEILISLIPYYLKTGGLFIASGIIRDRVDDILNVYRDAGFIPIDREYDGEWTAMVFEWQGSL